MKHSFKRFIIHLFKGYTKEDVDKIIEEDRSKREKPVYYVSALTVSDEAFAKMGREKVEKLLYQSVYNKIINDSHIHVVRNLVGNYSNYYIELGVTTDGKENT